RGFPPPARPAAPPVACAPASRVKGRSRPVSSLRCGPRQPLAAPCGCSPDTAAAPAGTVPVRKLTRPAGSLRFRPDTIGAAMQSTIFRSTHSVRDIATSDLPRDRLLSRGACALSNTELLAVLFGCDPERIRADVCAAGGLAGYMIRHDGALSSGRKARVHAALELARRVMGEELAGREALTSPRDSAAYLKARLAHLPY